MFTLLTVIWVSPVDGNGEPVTSINCKRKTSMTFRSPGPWMPTTPSVICSHMWRHGFLSDSVYAADHTFGEKVGRGNLYHGYITWASPLVGLMQHSAWLTSAFSATFSTPWAASPT